MTSFDFASFQQQVIDEFRRNRGRVGGPFEGEDLLLLTTIGARTGKPRTSPLGHLLIDGVPVVVASAMGADTHPAWYHNLLVNPVVTVEHGTETYEAIADAPTGAARDALWAAVTAAEPGFADYQQKTTRRIPVVRLTRIDTAQLTWARGLGDFLVESHDWLRAELASLRGQADALVAGSPADIRPGVPGLGHQMQTHCLEFCTALTRHHTGEDQGAFPMLAQRFPTLAPVLRRLGEEHEVVARLQAELRSLTSAYAAGEVDPLRLRDELTVLTSRLEAHFAYEERTIVTALNTLGPAPTFD